MATHSPILLSAKGSEIWSFDGELHRCSYEQTETYQIMKAFLEDRDSAIRGLEETDKKETEDDALSIEKTIVPDFSRNEFDCNDELLDMVNSLL